MADERDDARETRASLPLSIPSGDQTVWADASPLIAAACNGESSLMFLIFADPAVLFYFFFSSLDFFVSLSRARLCLFFVLV